jgi:hypothetical protein
MVFLNRVGAAGHFYFACYKQGVAILAGRRIVSYFVAFFALKIE